MTDLLALALMLIVYSKTVNDLNLYHKAISHERLCNSDLLQIKGVDAMYIADHLVNIIGVFMLYSSGHYKNK